MAGLYRAPPLTTPVLGPRFSAPEPRAARRSEPWEVSITLHPATAQDQDSQFVCCTLLLAVPPQVGPGQRWAPLLSLPLSLFSPFFSFFFWSLCSFLVSQRGSGHRHQEPAGAVG